MPNLENNEDVSMSILSQSSNDTLADITQLKINKLASELSKLEFNKISNHFSFGNQNANSDSLMNKTSNNKLDQSLRVNYTEMCDLLKSYKPFGDSSIEALNQTYENDYFPEWYKLMKYNLIIFFYF